MTIKKKNHALAKVTINTSDSALSSISHFMQVITSHFMQIKIKNQKKLITLQFIFLLFFNIIGNAIPISLSHFPKTGGEKSTSSSASSSSRSCPVAIGITSSTLFFTAPSTAKPKNSSSLII
jgi:hypothetical protein